VAAELVVLARTVLPMVVNSVTGLWSIRTNQAQLVAKLVLKALGLTMDAAQRETADAFELSA